MALVNLREIERLATEKEKEWKDANSLQISSLLSALEKKENECVQHKEMLLQLKQDFKYNLSLLQQRDKELERYDELIIKAKTAESAHVAEISDLRIKIAKLNDNVSQEQQAKSDMQKHSRQQFAEMQATIEMLKSSKEEEVEEVVTILNGMKSSHERIQTQLKAEIEAQRFELNAEFERKFKDKDYENRKKSEEMEAEVLAHELKCKFLEKELEQLKVAHKSKDDALQKAEISISHLRKQLLQAENDAKNISSVKNSRILELEAKVKSLIEQKSSAVEDFEEKRKQMDKDIRIKLSNMEVVRKKFSDRECALEKEISKLQSKVNACEQETKRTLQDLHDIKRNHEMDVHAFERESQDLKLRLENQAKAHHLAIVTKDVEIQNLRQKNILLITEIERLKDNIKMQEQQLAEAKQKENLLLQSKVQLKLDWQQKCQEEKTQQHEQSESVIKSLTKSRDDAVTELKHLKSKLKIEGSEWTDHSMSVDEVTELQSQNRQLKEVIEQMSQAMQHAVEQGKESYGLSDKKDKSEDQAFSAEYVSSLENQVLHLKKEIRKAQELAQINEKNTTENEEAVKFQLPQPHQAGAGNVPNFRSSYAGQFQGGQALFNDKSKFKHRLGQTTQDCVVAKAVKSPSKAAYLINHLQEKLAKAVSQITLLSQEKSQLLEIGNSLKSEVAALRHQRLQTSENSGNTGVTSTVTSEEELEEDNNKLKQLEDLQYQLTRQELQFAQRVNRNKPLELQADTLENQTDFIAPTKDVIGGGTASLKKGTNVLQYSLSTVGDTSAKNIWTILDQGTPSPSLPRSEEDSGHVHQVANRKLPSQGREKIGLRDRKSKTSKIRNYNIKDDDEAKHKMHRK